MVKDFPLLPLERIAKNAGAERISKDALKELKFFVLDICEKIAKEAIEITMHAKRITVKKEDIEFASRNLR